MADVSDAEFWIDIPHVFTPARWDEQCCRRCARAEYDDGVAHLDRAGLGDNDPRRCQFDDQPTGLLRETWFKVEGWNDGSEARCTYAPDDTFEAAQARARRYVERGDDEGRHYDHYGVAVFHHRSVVDVDYIPVC